MKSENTVQSNNETSNRKFSSTVITKRNQEVYAQEVITSRKIHGTSASINSIMNSSEEDSRLIPIGKSTVVSSIKEGPKTVRTITTTTYRKRIIRRTAANGEVTEEVIEEGDPNCGKILMHPIPYTNSNVMLSETGNNFTENNENSKNVETGSYQKIDELKSLSLNGQEKLSSFSTKPFIKSQESGKALDVYERGNIFFKLNNSESSVQQILPDGSMVSKKFYSTKYATVTESETIKGETKTSKKSAFMHYKGENLIQTNSTINDIEVLFRDMTAHLKIEGFNVLNKFLLSSNNNIIDHLALAGGNSGSSLLAIQGLNNSHQNQDGDSFNSHIILKSAMEEISHIPKQPLIESIIKVEEQQQEEVRKKVIAIKEEKASNRLFWSNMDEVISSGILNSMKKERIYLQEGIFEIITSEASYNISLDILIEYYYYNDLFNPKMEDAIINAVEKHHLFSNILLIKAVSLQFLKDLENRWIKHKPIINDLADIILKHVEDTKFEQQYINYIANQSYQIKCLKDLLQRETFKTAILKIQNKPECYKLSLDSFLALPMQRLTRLKLLIDVVMKLMNQSKELYNSIPEKVINNHAKALTKVKELLNRCESEKYKFEVKARLFQLTNLLEFSAGCKAVALGSKLLIEEGEFKAHIPQLYPCALKKLSKKKQPYFYLILLNDLLIIAKKRSTAKLVVLDYCSRGQVDAITHNSIQAFPYRKLSREKNINSQLSVSFSLAKESSENVTEVGAGQTFLLKFNKSESGALFEPLTLIAPSTECRNQWIDAITANRE